MPAETKLYEVWTNPEQCLMEDKSVTQSSVFEKKWLIPIANKDVCGTKEEI